MQCGAKTRSGEPCKTPAMATGRCRMHGGSQPVGADSPNLIHGRYSPYLKAELQKKLADVQIGDPLDLLPELEVQRALLSDYLSRFQTGNPTGFDINFMMGWSAEIGRMVERIVKMRLDTALTRAEMQFLAARIVELVGKYVVDPDQRQAFISELFAGVPTLAEGDVG